MFVPTTHESLLKNCLKEKNQMGCSARTYTAKELVAAPSLQRPSIRSLDLYRFIGVTSASRFLAHRSGVAIGTQPFFIAAISAVSLNKISEFKSFLLTKSNFLSRQFLPHYG